MARHITIEEEKKLNPALLLIDTGTGVKNTLLDLLVEDLGEKTRIYALTKKNVSGKLDKISPLSIHFLDRISDDLGYAVLFLDEEKQKKKAIEILEKLRLRNTKVLVLIPYRISDQFIDLYIQNNQEKNILFGFLGDVFGVSTPDSGISKILLHSFVKKEVVLSNDNLLSIFPIYDRDAVSSIEYILFGASNNASFYSLFYSYPQTLTSLAHSLKRVEPDLSVKFQKNDKIEASIKTQTQLDRYLFERTGKKTTFPAASMQKFEKSVLLFQKDMGRTLKPEKKKKRIRFQKRHVSLAFQFIKYGIFACILYAVFVSALFLGSVIFLKSGAHALFQGNLEQAGSAFSMSQKLYSFTKIPIQIAASMDVFTNGKLQEKLVLYDDLLTITEDFTPLLQNKNSNFSLSSQNLTKTISSITELYFLMNRYDSQDVKKITSTKAYQNVPKLLSLFSTLPQVLGYTSEKTYLVLFQNNNELRPTGGFIGSVGLLTVKNGRIESLDTQDVYDLDGQLKGHVDPPYIVRRFLSPHLYLRDSNFDASFENAASTSAFMYNLETSKKVDGVIAIDTEVLKAIVSVIEPVTVPGVQYPVTSKNVISTMQDTIQENNFEGTNIKKQIVGTLLNKIFVTIMDDKNKQIEVIKKIPKLMFQKHILFSFEDDSLEKAFIGAGVAGSMRDLREPANILPDVVSINEANIGVNKENQFVARKVTYSAFLKSNVLDSDALVEYKNNGKDQYKAYIRLFAPFGSKLLQLSIDGVSQTMIPAITNPVFYERRGFKAPSGLEVGTTTENGYTVFGFLAEIPAGKTQRIRFLYENTKIVPASSDFVYSLFYIKQPGTLSYPLTVQLQADNSMTIEPQNGSSSPILFDGNVETDLDVRTTIAKSN